MFKGEFGGCMFMHPFLLLTYELVRERELNRENEEDLDMFCVFVFPFKFIWLLYFTHSIIYFLENYGYQVSNEDRILLEF